MAAAVIWLQPTCGYTLHSEEAAELAKKSVADLQRPLDTASVHAVQPVPLSSVSCHRCGGKHNASSCHVKSAVCYNCGKPGHFARNAPKRGRKDAERPSGQAPEETENTYTLFTVKYPSQIPMTLVVTINGVDLVMEVDTGRSRSVYHQ